MTKQILYHFGKVHDTDRDLSIDRYRGALVLMMVIGDYIAGVNWIPDFLKHAPDIGFTIADTVAPAFVFVIGLNYETSFLRRFEKDQSAAYKYFLMRYVALLGIGAVLTAGANLVDRPTGWGVLESLGVAGVLTLLVIRLPIWLRFTIALLLLTSYQYFLDNYLLESVLGSGHGGFYGSLSWTAQLILATCVAAMWRKGNRPYLLCNLGLLVITAIAVLVVPVSKNRVSLSYVLLSLTISSIVFLLIKSLERFGRTKSGLFCWWGRNSLALYLIHLLVLSIFGLPNISWWYAEVPLWLFGIQLTVILGFMSALAYLFNRSPKTKSA